jgi:hypothetical protein
MRWAVPGYVSQSGCGIVRYEKNQMFRGERRVAPRCCEVKEERERVASQLTARDMLTRVVHTKTCRARESEAFL